MGGALRGRDGGRKERESTKASQASVCTMPRQRQGWQGCWGALTSAPRPRTIRALDNQSPSPRAPERPGPRLGVTIPRSPG